ncbi:hypothetical protein GWD52_21110 [Enterobacteriaceae bacterium 4M9]|nr:hypothetical protein [Enterobacteriaceae bacterium 4M9]
MNLKLTPVWQQVTDGKSEDWIAIQVRAGSVEMLRADNTPALDDLGIVKPEYNIAPNTTVWGRATGGPSATLVLS